MLLDWAGRMVVDMRLTPGVSMWTMLCRNSQSPWICYSNKSYKLYHTIQHAFEARAQPSQLFIIWSTGSDTDTDIRGNKYWLISDNIFTDTHISEIIQYQCIWKLPSQNQTNSSTICFNLFLNSMCSHWPYSLLLFCTLSDFIYIFRHGAGVLHLFNSGLFVPGRCTDRLKRGSSTCPIVS